MTEVTMPAPTQETAVTPQNLPHPEDKKPSFRERLAKVSPRNLLKSWSSESKNPNPNLDGSILNRKMSRREFNTNTLKVVGAAIATTTLAEYLTACTPEDRPLTENEKIILTSVKIYTDAEKYELNHDDEVKVEAKKKGLGLAINAINSSKTLDESITSYHAFKKVVKGNENLALFVSGVALGSNKSTEDMQALFGESKKIKGVDDNLAWKIAGYTVISGKSPEEIYALGKLSNKITGHDVLMPALLATADTQKVINTYKEIDDKGYKTPSQLTFAAGVNNWDINNTLKVDDSVANDYQSEQIPTRQLLTLSRIITGDDNKVKEMFVKAKDQLHEEGISAALTLITLNKDPKLASIAAGVKVDSGGIDWGWYFNPASPFSPFNPNSMNPFSPSTWGGD